MGGRAPTSNFALQDPGTSLIQCSMETGQVTLKDLGSKNGTHVNNQRVAEHQALQNCDMIAFGGTKMLLTLGG